LNVTAELNLTVGACRSWAIDSFQSTQPQVFFGGDAAYGPKNIITAVAHGHEAAVSIDRFLHSAIRGTTSGTSDQADVPENGDSRMELSQRRVQRHPVQGAMGNGRKSPGQHSV
jgi:hypothetical protein